MPGQGGVPGRRRAPLGQNGVAKSPHKDMLMPVTDLPIRPPEPPRWQHRPTFIRGNRMGYVGLHWSAATLATPGWNHRELRMGSI